MKWSAAEYCAFERERTRPAIDLVAALPEIDARSVVDLGCGPGNSTAVLAARFPAALLHGIDNSADMLGAARRRLPAALFELMDIEHWAHPPSGPGERFDVVLANASLQWLPDHRTLFPALCARVRAGGALAVQMPDNLDEPAHRLMRDVAAHGPWAARIRAAARAPLGGAEFYYDTLRAAGCAVDLWRTTYHHPLSGGIPALIEWFEGTGLRPFLEPLDAPQRAAYLAAYREALAAAYPLRPDGAVLLPFPRLFIMAMR